MPLKLMQQWSQEGRESWGWEGQQAETQASKAHFEASDYLS